MTTYIQPASLSIVSLWTGRIITGLVMIFLAFDGVTKIIQVAPVVEASKKLDITSDSLLGIGRREPRDTCGEAGQIGTVFGGDPAVACTCEQNAGGLRAGIC